MKDATHFIEVFKSVNFERLIHAPLLEIKFLDKSLDTTIRSPQLTTIAVWKICMK